MVDSSAFISGRTGFDANKKIKKCSFRAVAIQIGSFVMLDFMLSSANCNSKDSLQPRVKWSFLAFERVYCTMHNSNIGIIQPYVFEPR